METTIDVSQYLTDEEIKEIVQNQVRAEVKSLFKDEKNASRILVNLSYNLVYDEIDKIVGDSRGVVINKTEDIIKDIRSYSVFRDGSYGNTPSLAYKIMEEAVRTNKDLINDKVKETIINKDYSEKIWDTFENLAESFMANIYEITRLGREKK